MEEMGSSTGGRITLVLSVMEEGRLRMHTDVDEL
jgi:hypothetical protein